jgi:hypothetical protein
MCHYKHLKPTGEELHSRAVWHKGSSIGFIAHKTGKDRSSVCAAQNPKGGQLPAHGR